MSVLRLRVYLYTLSNMHYSVIKQTKPRALNKSLVDRDFGGGRGWWCVLQQSSRAAQQQSSRAAEQQKKYK